MAIEEAKMTKETLGGNNERHARIPGAAARRARPQLGADPLRHRGPAAPSWRRSVEALRGRVTELTDWRSRFASIASS